MTNPMIAQELDALVEAFEDATKVWGYESDQGTTRHNIELAKQDYTEAKAALTTAITALRGEVDTLRAERDGLLAALEIMTKHYVQLANCGDCGFWDPEAEDEVIQARAAILAAVGGTERAKEEPKP